METKKIGLACAIGAGLGTLTACKVNPSFWWIGLVVGFLAGYLAYEFREVLRAIPVAIRGAAAISGFVLKEVFTGLRKPHPFGLPTFTLACITGWFLLEPFREAAALRMDAPSFFAHGMVALVCYVFMGVFTWIPMVAGIIKHDEYCREVCYEHGNPDHPRPLTYGNAVRWTFTGAWFIPYSLVRLVFIVAYYVLKFFCWMLPKFIGIAVYLLVKIIHSERRLLCAVDAAIGTGIAYVVWGRNASSASEIAFAVVCGMVLGAVFGILNWKLVSVRLFKLSAS